MPLPSDLSYIGIAKESVKGTGVAATFYIPVDQSSLAPIDHQDYVDDQALRGSMVETYNTVPTTLWSEFGFGGPVFADSIGFPIAGVLGDYAQSGTAPTLHTASVKNSGDGQPTSYSLTDFYGLTGGTPARQFAGMQFTDVAFKWAAAGLLQYTAKTVGFASALVAKPTASFGTVTPTPAWECTATIGGAGVTYIESAEWSMKRSGGPIHTADGTQAPYKIFVGACGVSGKLIMVMEDDTELIRYLTNTQPSLDLAFSHGAGATQAGVTFHGTKVAYKMGKITRGKEYVEVECDWEAIANTTDVGASGGYSPCKITVKNQQATSLFA